MLGYLRSRPYHCSALSNLNWYINVLVSSDLKEQSELWPGVNVMMSYLNLFIMDHEVLVPLLGFPGPVMHSDE